MTVKTLFQRSGNTFLLQRRSNHWALYKELGNVRAWHVLGIGRKPKPKTFPNGETVTVFEEFLKLSDKNFRSAESFSYANAKEAVDKFAQVVHDA